MIGYRHLSVLLLAGCASITEPVTVQMKCEDVKPAVVKYIDDPKAFEWCKDHGAKTTKWGGLYGL